MRKVFHIQGTVFRESRALCKRAATYLIHQCREEPLPRPRLL